MKKITAIIIDDEASNIDVLQKSLQQYCPLVQVLGTASNITQGEQLINEQQPQIVFLDIEMPMGNGFELLQKLLPFHFNVVFTTAFNKYAVQAFKFSAVDYLLKPIDPIELIAAVQKVIEKVEANAATDPRMDNFMVNMKTETPGKKKITLIDGDTLVFQEIEAIMHISADGNYTTLHLNNKKKQVVIKPLSEFEEILPKSLFFRTHNSHIININYIKKYHKGRGGFVEMEDDTKIEIAVRKRDDFLKLING